MNEEDKKSFDSRARHNEIRNLIPETSFGRENRLYCGKQYYQFIDSESSDVQTLKDKHVCTNSTEKEAFITPGKNQ